MSRRHHQHGYPQDDRPVENEEYYHGLLPREDLPYLLREEGDFVVRSSEVKHDQNPQSMNATTANQHRQLIVSVCMSKGISLETREIKHVVIQKLPDGRYCFDDRMNFRTVPEMISDFIYSKESLFGGLSVIISNPVKRQRWELRHDDIEFTKKLGEGAFGEVHQGKLLHRSGRRVEVAIKLAKAEMTKEKIKEMMKEARLMRNFDHPNIVKLYGVAVEREPLLIVMEYVNGGALDSYLMQNHLNITPTEKLERMVMGAAFGLEYLHEKNCIHRDIAARNCLYADGRQIKISDFGLSRLGEQYVLKRVCMVPIKWSAPETITSLVYTHKTDVWSFGVLVYEVFAVQEPFKDFNNAEVKQRVTSGFKLNFPIDTNPHIVSLISDHCWALRAEERWSMSQVVRRLQNLTGVPGPTIASSNLLNVSAERKVKKKKKVGDSAQFIDSSKKLMRKKKKRDKEEH